MRVNTKKFIEKYLRIVDKESKNIPFKLNTPQLKIYDAFKKCAELKKPIRVIVLKMRQMGSTTLCGATGFTTAMTIPNSHIGVITHKSVTTENVTKMYQNFYNNLPQEFKPHLQKNNTETMEFDGLNSWVKYMTAGGGDGTGVGETYTYIHASEVSRYPRAKETLVPLLATVPSTLDSVVVIESTARGFDYFHELWQQAVNGESDYIPVFCAWYELEEYRMAYSGFELTDEEEELKRVFNLDNDQLEWRRYAIKNICGGSVELFHQDFPSTPEEAFLFSGESIFTPTTTLNAILNRKEKDFVQGNFTFKKFEEPFYMEGKIVSTTTRITDIEFEKKEKGIFKIYEFPQVEKKGNKTYKHLYSIGVDTSGDGSDYYAFKVKDSITGFKACTGHIRGGDENELAYQLYCLGKFYNDALIGVEVNFSTYIVRRLDELEYPNQYKRQVYDGVTDVTTFKHGFRTDRATKPQVVWNLVAITREHPELEPNHATLKEMLTFVRTEEGRLEAVVGCHDDLVMADAICEQVDTQQEHSLQIEEEERLDLTQYFHLEENDDEGGTELEW